MVLFVADVLKQMGVYDPRKLIALDRAEDVYKCLFVESPLVKGVRFFTSTVKLGKQGVEDFDESELEGLTKHETRELRFLQKELTH
ncbi:unnamed protein product [Microthlaspi erraticum]|uniref:Uncharacterized protein n=1 Tax=Microthlaspi erraticum TaxID=1685480 RepID=A0A6D2JT15_9BRAS|nr:unnamed protein product [Microthlaspi erraticum]